MANGVVVIRTRPEWMSQRQWRGCGRKRFFQHQGHAQRAAEKAGVTAYSCEFCKGWHLTKRRHA